MFTTQFKPFGFIIVILISYAGLVSSVSQQVITKTLHTYLFTDYDKDLLPSCNSGDNVTVTVDLALRQVLELNEPQQVLTSNVWMRLSWKDCRLSWTPTSYNNVTNFNVLYDKIWFPDITLYDSAADSEMFPGRSSFYAGISSSGAVTYNFPSVLKSVCRVNVQYFPFDTQKCSLQFGSWTHHGEELDILNKNPTGDTDYYVENNEWILKQLPVTRTVLYYNCCPQPYPDVTFHIYLLRRPSFYVLTMLFPCILVSFVSALTFVLPVEAGEKISLEITVLLSLAVFLLVVSESLPPSADDFPVIGTYFAVSMVLVSLSLLQTVIVLNVYHRGSSGRKVPRWLKIICFKYIGRVLLITPGASGNEVQDLSGNRPEAWKRSPSMDTSFITDATSVNNLVTSNSDEPTEHIPKTDGKLRFLSRPSQPTLNLADPQISVLQDLNDKLEYITDSMKEKSKEDDINSEWQDVANVLDRLFLILYCFVNTVTVLAFILQIS